MSNTTSYSQDRQFDYWWKEEGDEQIAGAVFANVEYLDQEQGYRRTANLHYLRMYSNRLATGLSGDDYAINDEGERIKLNVIKSCVDTAQAHIATNRPRPMFLTTGGNRSQITRAKNLNKFVAGQFYGMDQYATALRVFFGAAIFGNGYEKVYSIGGKIHSEHVFTDEIIVDDVEARDDDPRQMYQHKEFNREVAMELWPKKAQELEHAALIRNQGSPRTRPADRISVVEAWHLPSGPGAKDGRHLVCASSCVLLDEPWERESFPFARFQWSEPPLGYHGIGIVEEIQGIQVELNYLIQKMQRLANLATTQIWTKKGDNVGQMDNQDIGHRSYRTSPPVAVQVRPWTSEFGEQVERLYSKAFEIVGISQLGAQGTKPAGLNSGEALRVYNDVTSKRFIHVGQRWENFHLKVAELVLDEARAIEEAGGGGLKVMSAGVRDIEEIKFRDVSIDKDKYIMKVWPTSLLPDTPQGKIQTITELSQASPEIGAQAIGLLTGIPDIEAIVSRINAPYALVDLYIERIVEHGEYNAPLPYMNLDLARQQAQLALNQGHKEGVEEERLELLRRFIDQANKLVDMSQPPPPAPPGPAGPPPAGPGAPIDAGPVPGAMPPGMPPGIM